MKLFHHDPARRGAAERRREPQPNTFFQALCTIALVWLLILAALFYSSSLFADSVRFEAQGGFCKQTRDEFGIWWNGHYPTSIDVTDACVQIGVSHTPWRLGEYRTGWRMAYVNLGRVKFDNTFAMRDDEQPLNPSGNNCRLSDMLGCVGRGIAGGATYGFTAGLIGEREWRKVTFGAETGAFVYYSEFNVTIYSVPQNREQFSAAALNIGDWTVTPYAGMNMRYGWLTLSARGYAKVTAHTHNCGGCSGITNGPAWQFMGGLSVPLE